MQHKKRFLLFLLFVMGVFGGASAFAADVDGDGVSDVDEVTEYGTNPFLADIAGMVADAEVRVASLPASFRLEGQRLLVTGYAPRQAGSVEFRLEHLASGETVAVLLLRPDDRGVFSGLWPLADVCSTTGKGNYRLVVQERTQHHVDLQCGEGEVLLDSTFAGTPLVAGERVMLSSGAEAIFEAKGQTGLRVYAVYASLVFAKDLYAEGNGLLRVVPWKYLSSGAHTLYVMPYDPIRKIVYAPVVVPFDVAEGWGEQMKSSLYYAPGGILIILMVFVGSVVYIRRTRSMRRGISLVGEEYPDED